MELQLEPTEHNKHRQATSQLQYRKVPSAPSFHQDLQYGSKPCLFTQSSFPLVPERVKCMANKIFGSLAYTMDPRTPCIIIIHTVLHSSQLHSLFSTMEAFCNTQSTLVFTPGNTKTKVFFKPLRPKLPHFKNKLDLPLMSFSVLHKSFSLSRKTLAKRPYPLAFFTALSIYLSKALQKLQKFQSTLFYLSHLVDHRPLIVSHTFFHSYILSTIAALSFSRTMP